MSVLYNNAQFIRIKCENIHLIADFHTYIEQVEYL